jgi:hypothetical protein
VTTVSKIGDVLRGNTIRYVDPESDPGSNECVDVTEGTWLKARPKKGQPARPPQRVLRVDVQAKAVRFDLGSDDANGAPDARTKWERVVSFDNDLPFFDVVDDPSTAIVFPPEPAAPGVAKAKRGEAA